MLLWPRVLHEKEQRYWIKKLLKVKWVHKSIRYLLRKKREVRESQPKVSKKDLRTICNVLGEILISDENFDIF